MKKSNLIASTMLIAICGGCITGGGVDGDHESKPRSISRERYQGVIIPVSLARSDPTLSSRFTDFWLPTDADIDKAELAISSYFSAAHQDATLPAYMTDRLPDIAAKLPEYRRQYVGVISNGERRILCNALTRSAWSGDNDWKKRYVHLGDRPGCWRIEYDCDTGRCFRFFLGAGY